MQQKVKLNDVIDLDIKRMGINGEGIGYYEKLAIFVDHTLPGEVVQAKITQIYDNRAIAELKHIVTKSKNRVTPFCPVYDACGGCQTQHFDYHAMLAQKKDILAKSLDRYLKTYPKDLIQDTVGMENPMHYRNKASLPLKKMSGKNRFGMYARGTNQFVAIHTCGVQHIKINEVFNTLVTLMDKYQIDAYDTKSKKGFISHAVVRISENLGEMQVSLIVPKRIKDIEPLVNELVSLHQEIVSVFEVVNSDHKKQSFFTDKSFILYGKETIDETLNGHHFMLKPEAFFQLNTYQADKFYQQMESFAALSGTEVVIDAYAGIAPISHYIHKKAKKVYAIELNKDAASSAKLSLNKNQITNVEVINKDFKKALENLKETRIDVMLFDPPRTGLGEDTIHLIKKYKPKRLVYGSCNPSTLAKDLNELKDMYEIKEIIPFDMFPYTSLVESISLLELKTAL